MSPGAILRPLFISLPTPRGIDPEGLLEGYFVALDGLPLSAVQSVVTKLVKGTWYEAVTFCPRPPELANMVRKEQASMRERARPHLPMLPSKHDFKDIRVTHQQRAEELASKGYVLLDKCQSIDEFVRRCKKREFPVGTINLWAIDQVWAPAVKEMPTSAERDAA